MSAPSLVPCRVCDATTSSLGTRLCDRCWELESRIRSDPQLARKILDQLCEHWCACCGKSILAGREVWITHDLGGQPIVPFVPPRGEPHDLGALPYGRTCMRRLLRRRR